jgi:LPS sulfotransferase NodH
MNCAGGARSTAGGLGRAGGLTWSPRRRRDRPRYVGGNGEIGGSAGTGGPTSFDAGQIGWLIQVVGEHNAAWEAWFASAGVRPLRVSYEELDAGMAGVTLGTLGFLGLDVPDGQVIARRHERQADELSAQWIERYRLESAGSW